MRIVTVTLNPSLDRTLELTSLAPGQVNRATSAQVDPGGKGVNVARALVANGIAARAVLPVGGPEGAHLAALIEALGIDTDQVQISESVRTNVSLVEPDGTVTKINAAGPRLRGSEIATMTEVIVDAAEDADWIAACGSLPPGVPDDAYADLIGQIHRRGGRIAIDASGAPMGAAVAAGPDVVKPNASELAAVVDREPATFGGVVTAAGELRQRGVGVVLVSLGADGAVLVDDSGALHADTPRLTPRSNVGAGDAALAGFLAAGGHGADALRQAVAWGAAAVRLPGTAMPRPEDIDLAEVRLQDIDPERPLSE